jgi:hypothetical protein
MDKEVVIKLSWQKPFASSVAVYGTSNWIYNVIWRRVDRNSLMAGYTGLYIIEDPHGNQLYAGRASKLRDRFDGRTKALREFRLSTQINPVENYEVRVASVNPHKELKTAEEWLIRILYLAQQDANALILQNLQSTKQFTAPKGGLSIINVDNGNKPDYLDDSYAYNGGNVI